MSPVRAARVPAVILTAVLLPIVATAPMVAAAVQLVALWRTRHLAPLMSMGIHLDAATAIGLSTSTALWLLTMAACWAVTSRAANPAAWLLAMWVYAAVLVGSVVDTPTGSVRGGLVLLLLTGPVAVTASAGYLRSVTMLRAHHRTPRP